MHLHFIVWAWDSVVQGAAPGLESYINNTTIELIAKTSEEAIERAKALVPKKLGYAVRTVIEHFDGACSGHGHD